MYSHTFFIAQKSYFFYLVISCRQLDSSTQILLVPNLTCDIIPSKSLLFLNLFLSKWIDIPLIELSRKTPLPTCHKAPKILYSPSYIIYFLHFYCHLFPAATIFLLTAEMTLNLLIWIPFFFFSCFPIQYSDCKGNSLQKHELILLLSHVRYFHSFSFLLNKTAN